MDSGQGDSFSGSGYAGVSSSHPAKLDVMPRKGLQRNLRSAAKQIGAESPTPHSGGAPKNRKSKLDFKPNIALSRVCKAPLPYQRHGVKPHFRNANAERMRNPLAGAYAKRYFQTLRHGVKAALGTLTRSVCKPAGGRWRGWRAHN
jgi:hypothetical protein